MSQYPPPGPTPGGPMPGAPMPGAPMQYQAPQASQGLAIGSLICGIVSIVLSLFVCLWFLAVPLGIVAVILAIVARGKIARGEAGGAGAAKAGLITGIIGILLSIVITITISVFFREAGNRLQQEIERQQRLQEQQGGTPTPAPSERLVVPVR